MQEISKSFRMYLTIATLLLYHINPSKKRRTCPFEYIRHKVDVKVTENAINIFYKRERIASHRRMYARKGQYSTVTEHMPQDHQRYLEWNGDRFRNWANKIGINTYNVIDRLLRSKSVEQQTYRGCMGILKLSEKYSPAKLEKACEKALRYTASPSFHSIKTIISASTATDENEDSESKQPISGITRGADYYRR